MKRALLLIASTLLCGACKKETTPTATAHPADIAAKAIASLSAAIEASSVTFSLDPSKTAAMGRAAQEAAAAANAKAAEEQQTLDQIDQGK